MKKLDDNTMQDEAGDLWVKQPRKEWPQVGSRYVAVCIDGDKSLLSHRDDIDNRIFAQGNAFRYEKNAQNLIDYRAAMVVLSKSEGARGFVAGELNYSISYLFGHVVYVTISRNGALAIPIYFDTPEQAKAAIDLIGKEKLDRLLRWYHTERYFEEAE